MFTVSTSATGYVTTIAQELSRVSAMIIIDNDETSGKMLQAQKAVFSHAPPPASDRDSPRRTGTHLGNVDHNDAPQDKPAVQLHNPSSQPRLVECERVTRQQMSLNG
jgi:hypothetical protein